MPAPQPRSVSTVVDAVRTLEGGGFPVRRPFPGSQLPQADPFLLLDHIGPIEWKPGEAIGAPDHPHRGFETISYVLAGRKQHKDSQGHTGLLGPGDVQWMTAGGGVIHSEMPEAEFRRTGGLAHGFQIWVNLPARDKMMPPRYQDVPAARIPQATGDDGRVQVRVIAGEALGVSAVIDTRTPIMFLHYTLHAGGRTLQHVPTDHNALAYVFAGTATLGQDARVVREGQLALFSPGEAIAIAAGPPAAGDNGSADGNATAHAAGKTELLLLTGVPLNEPVAWMGPFVMNTREQILQAVEDYQAGRMGRIDF